MISADGRSERIGFATILLDADARLEKRDDLLRSPPLGRDAARVKWSW
jgi:hypothetical protein